MKIEIILLFSFVVQLANGLLVSTTSTQDTSNHDFMPTSTIACRRPAVTGTETIFAEAATDVPFDNVNNTVIGLTSAPPEPDLENIPADQYQNFVDDAHVPPNGHGSDANIASNSLHIVDGPPSPDGAITTTTVVSIVVGCLIFVGAYLALYFFLGYHNLCGCGKPKVDAAPLHPPNRTLSTPPIARISFQWIFLVLKTTQRPRRSTSHASFGTQTATTLVNETELTVRHTTPVGKDEDDKDEAVALFLAGQAALFYTLKWALDEFLPERKSEKVNTKQLEALDRLGHSNLKLDEHERTIANEIIHPDDIHVTFSDIGGLDPIIASLRESVIYPLVYPHLFSSSSLLSSPKGVLLYGPPGCGKTMVAKCLAKESGASFYNIAASTLANKWFGESNKLVAALFKLARKTQPCIIFIDEIDSFLRERSSNDHEVTGMMKAEFMTQWDGLLSSTDRILVLGATNRPNDIDAAILRRMPKRYAVQLPGYEQRMSILNLILQETPLAPDFPVAKLAEMSNGLSGSDLKELCRNAAMVPVREFVRNANGESGMLEVSKLEGFHLRPLTLEDFLPQNQHDAAGALPAMVPNDSTLPIRAPSDDRTRLDEQD
ncbi:AAA domain-containing protein [Mycena kentingensis (nom. inval.)]|nr:AAA domain-containing protein [Mycena kentingensis (nom. inval.)]